MTLEYREYCCECDQETNNAGRGEDSIYIGYPDKEVGPLCDKCRGKHWVCEKCGEGVYPKHVTYQETHDGCGGICS
jgi:hypothetical protein